MAKTIQGAISGVLKNAKGPLSAQAIYEEVCRRNLYEFKAKNPSHIVRSTLRRHCVNVELPQARGEKCFRMTDDGLFMLSSSNKH